MMFVIAALDSDGGHVEGLSAGGTSAVSRQPRRWQEQNRGPISASPEPPQRISAITQVRPMSSLLKFITVNLV